MWSCRGRHGQWYPRSHGACRAHRSSWPPQPGRGTRETVPEPSAAAIEPAVLRSDWRPDLPKQRFGVRAQVQAWPPRTTPIGPQPATVLPSPSPLKRGVVRSKVVAAIVVVLTPRGPGTEYPVPARALRNDQWQLEDTSGGSEGREGKSGRL